ncbi:methionine--tRNA ligase [Candidatus Woesearchaeota archaeon]|nr:methionine--tRNA ligase [Candidatus Woesearchaeota archaeon]
MAKKAFYITTPIYYVNDVPHIGHAYTTIAADVLARWHRLNGEKVFFLTGTDEHGQKVEKAASEKGIETKQFVDMIVPRFVESWKTLNISFDRFIRTTEEDHKKGVIELIKKCHKNNDIYKGFYEGNYCVPCETFYTEKDLVNNNCPSCGRETKIVKEESYFFRLSRYEKALLELYETSPSFISPDHRKQEIINRVKEGLKDLSITRTSFSWGIPFPLDEHHVTYVWFDALTNYLTGIGWPSKKFASYWPADIHLVGKEILWFHTVIWPAMLMSAGVDIPGTVYAHGWLTINGEKMSKSKGNFIPPSELIRKYGVDGTRYGLLRDIPFGMDGDFNEPQLIKRIHGELADSLGNLLQRTLTMVHKYCNGVIPKPGIFGDDEKRLQDVANNLFAHLNEHIQKLEFHKGLETIWSFVAQCNKYVNDQKPWDIHEPKRLNTVLYTLSECLRLIGHAVLPFMPSSGEKMLAQLGQKQKKLPLQFETNTSGKIAQPEILFSKSVVIDEPFSAVDLRVAIIKDIKPHPNADKLYVLEIDVGEKRTLCAGLRNYYSADELKGKSIVIVYNLKPANLRGIESQGMLLASQKADVVKILHPKGTPGEPVTISGMPRTPKQQITIEDFKDLKLKTSGTKVVYKDKPLQTSQGEVFSELDDAVIV